MRSILDLFLTFAKVGLFTFGGGYAMIALIFSPHKLVWNGDYYYMVGVFDNGKQELL